MKIVNFGISIEVRNIFSFSIGDKLKALSSKAWTSKEPPSNLIKLYAESLGAYEVIFIPELKFTLSISVFADPIFKVLLIEFANPSEFKIIWSGANTVLVANEYLLSDQKSFKALFKKSIDIFCVLVEEVSLIGVSFK